MRFPLCYTSLVRYLREICTSLVCLQPLLFLRLSSICCLSNATWERRRRFGSRTDIINYCARRIEYVCLVIGKYCNHYCLQRFACRCCSECFQYDTKQEKRQIPLWLRMHKLLRTRLLPQGEMKIATDGNIRNCMPIFVGIVLSQISLIWAGSVWRDFQSPEEQCFYCTGVAV